MKTTMERGGAAALTTVFLIVTFCLSTFDITEHDYWWHLATGKYIIENRTIPREDVFSFTATRPWVAHYWLSDVIGYAFYSFAGTPGMILLNAGIVTLSFWLVLRTAVAAGAGGLAGVGFSLLAVYASRSRFYVRPETCSFLLTAAYISLFMRWRKEGKSWPIAVFPVLQVLWTNLYGGGSVVGLVLLFSFCLGEILNAASSRPERRRKVWKLLLSSAAAFCLSFVNPNTYHTVFYFLMSRDPIFRHIVEWRHIGVADILGLHGLILALGAMLFICAPGRFDFTDLILFVAFGAMSVDAPRSLPFLAIVSVPILATRARDVVGRLVSAESLSPAFEKQRRWTHAALASAALAFTVWYLFSDLGHFGRDYSFGLGVNMKLVPVQAVDFMEKNRVEGPIFNSYGIGGYLIWRLYPGMKVFVDGRVEMYGTDFLREYMLYWRPEVWNGYVARYGINCAIIDREPNYTTRYLDESPDWRLVFFDDRAMVYLRNVPQNADLIRRYEYRHIRPGSTGFGYLDPLLADPMTAGAVIAELRRSLGDETYNLNARLMLGYCYTKLGRDYYPLALQEYRAAARLMPEGHDISRKIEWLEGQSQRVDSR